MNQEEIPSGAELLERVIPFRFLEETTRQHLAERLELRRFRAGDLVVRRGELSRNVFLLARGEVDAIDDHDPPQVTSTIVAGHYVGERACLFEKPRRVSLRASTDVLAYSLPGGEFVRLVEEVPTFAMALANTLKVKQGVFLPYRRLYARILALVDKGQFLLSELVASYEALHPALHPGMHEHRIDTAALGYAVARLPAQVTRTSFYFLASDLPLVFQDADDQFEAVHSAARRRSSWQPIPGKLIVLLRDGVSDITDLLTCLCLYAVEARKLRRRISSFQNLRALTALLDEEDEDHRRQRLSELDLSPEEFRGLLRIWPDDLARRLRDVLLHHEDVGLECSWEIDNYNSRSSEVWVSEIREQAQRLVDLDDPRLEVHIISSNTHSVANCLNAWLAQHREQVLAWARERRPELVGQEGCWRDETDLLYAAARHYLRAHPEAQGELEADQLQRGQLHLSRTAFTGIEVDLFDASRLEAGALDPAVPFQAPDRPTLIVNVDYAFGQQAEEILLNLLFEFGPRVRSVNVIGKAGGLSGQRGDVLLPRATLLQTNDELYPLPNLDVSREQVAGLVPDREVHEGPVLTVAGTLLQDRVLLWFYKRIWKCVGLEMEGSFFARQLISAMEAGVVGSDVKSRFLYYVSDVPLEPEETLSEGLAAWEGVPPLYAVTRAVLGRILGPAEV